MVMYAKSLGVVLMLAGAVRGGGVLVLEPGRAGPYEPASSVEVDILLHNQDGRTVQPGVITLDFSATDPMLALPDTFHFQLVPPLIGDFLYTRFETMPKVDIVYGSTAPQPGFNLEIPDGGSLLLGTISVGLPAGPGTYVLDAINADATKMDTGARVLLGFFDRPNDAWVPWNGTLTGGTLVMTVVPEPATILLMWSGVGSWFVCKRRAHPSPKRKRGVL